MKNLEVLTYENAPQESQQIFDQLKEKLGKVPNVYAAIGNSPKALGGLLGLADTLSKGEFTAKEVEAVALAVAEANTCDYCLAAHTTVGKMQGFSEEETVAIRTGEIADEKLKALSDLAKAITISRGKPEQNVVDAFHAAGYSKAALAELIGLVAVNTITNYANHLADTEIDFPAAPQLAEA
ncbi:carboxymuconolactone decarboxylase family protein [Marinoscillum furvescens]|uniref:Putative peroxidase-related enzyme n=1 Tax=Marinoscillum furvescens DSM 4134 TaxID=1122208 RepID=A0A3D9KYI5_MARFU|nr:carboxymuconolactone decarboxylase family protein [Marinoscillum furvescens]RED92796.1 putative peroxidase-related enzyme [Marinoscillum furvescens DSM 4134]